jgi:hypothetical protein
MFLILGKAQVFCDYLCKDESDKKCKPGYTLHIIFPIRASTLPHPFSIWAVKGWGVSFCLFVGHVLIVPADHYNSCKSINCPFQQIRNPLTVSDDSSTLGLGRADPKVHLDGIVCLLVTFRLHQYISMTQGSRTDQTSKELHTVLDNSYTQGHKWQTWNFAYVWTTVSWKQYILQQNQ